MILRADLDAGEPGEDRSLPRDLAAPGASAGPDRRGGADSSRAKARRSSTSTAACTRPKWPARSTRRCSPTTSLSKADEPATKAMLDNVVLMLWPTINPDGQQMVAEWYMKNVGTPYELSGLPRLYQDYVGHDNNRDAYMLNMIESRVIEHTWRQWEPQIIYVHHQSGPFPTRIWLPPFSEPVGIEAPYVIVARSEHDRHGDREGPRGERPGRRHAHGHRVRRVVSGLHRLRADFKNIAAFWTETALYPVRDAARPTPSTTFPQNMRDLRPQSLYSSPWPPGWWRLRDAVDYMETASLSVLEFASKYKDSLLLDRYKAGATRSRAARKRRRSRYVVPQEQRDPVAAVELLRRLAFGGVRVSQLTDAAHDRTATRTPPAPGSCRPTRNSPRWRARCSTCRRYPDLRQYPGGPPERPYDAAGWTLPLQMGVQVVAAATPLDRRRRARR